MDRFIREIAITEIDGVSIGHAQDNEAKTGASVLYFKRGAQAGCDISGGGPASRETPLTDSMTADNPLNAVVLSGGSAYGLAASDGVMRCLEEQGIGRPSTYAPTITTIIARRYGIRKKRYPSGCGYGI